MNKLFTKGLILVFGLGVAATFTACHTGEDVPTVVVDNVVIENARTLVVRSNVPATFTVGAQTQANTTEATFNPGVTGTVTVSATGRTSKTIAFDFADGSYLEYEVELESVGTEVDQAEAEAGTTTVDNSGANEEETGVTASMNFDNNQTNTGTLGKYSITVVTPTDINSTIEKIEQTKKVEEPVLALDCKPNGANFAGNPIKVNAKVPGSDGYNLACAFKNNGDTPASFERNGDNLTIGIQHFSIWNIVLKADLVSVDTKTVDQVITGDASKGSLAYQSDYGFSTDTQDAFIVKYLKKIFGVTKRSKAFNATFNPVDGTATLKVSQEVKTYKFKSNDKEFSATVYGKITRSLSIEVVEEEAEDVKTHDGGTTSKH